MPARAATIAIATSTQESKLYGEHGDRNKLGLFQQRPSQGWGSAEQILNPYYSINTFFDALARVDGYESMKVTEAAQLVNGPRSRRPTPTTRRMRVSWPPR